MVTKVITFRVPEEQRNILKEEAYKRNMNLSEYVRELVLSEKNVDNSRFQYRHFCDLLTEIQRLKVSYPDIDFERLEENAERIWLN